MFDIIIRSAFLYTFFGLLGVVMNDEHGQPRYGATLFYATPFAIGFVFGIKCWGDGVGWADVNNPELLITYVAWGYLALVIAFHAIIRRSARRSREKAIAC